MVSRQMCECENSRCPFHTERSCDLPSVAKIRWHGFLTTMCQQCLDIAVQTDTGNLEIVHPITAAVQQTLFPRAPEFTIIKNYNVHGDGGNQRYTGWRISNPVGAILSGVFDTPEAARVETLKIYPDAYVKMPRTARLLKKGAVTGNETFDRVWSDFHGKLSAPENEDREFHEVLGDHDSKHQLMIALGKLNYMMDESGGFKDWIAEGYAASTGDLLLKRLPSHTHVYPLLSKLHGMLKEVIEAYAEFGIVSFGGLERLFSAGPNRRTLWDWFKNANKRMFRFRGRVTEPYDLEYISGKWGHVRLDDGAITQDLLDKYEAELAEVEGELAAFPAVPEEKQEGKASARKRTELLEYQAELDSLLEALHYRMGLQMAWNDFKAGGWDSTATMALEALDANYHGSITLHSLVEEAAELFNATPDEVYSVERIGEEEAQDTGKVGLSEAANLA